MDIKSIPLKDVKSSNLKKVGYDEKNKVLVVTFNKHNTTYSYEGVDKETYDSLMSAKSKGEFFAKNIRYSAKYKMTKHV